MCMNEFVKKLYDFRGIYRIFWSQNSHYRYLPIYIRYLLIFYQYLPIYLRYLPIFYRYFFRNSSTCAREIKSRNFVEISYKYREFPIFRRYFDDFSYFYPIFWPTDYQLAISFRGLSILIFRPKKPKFCSLALTCHLSLEVKQKS